MKRQNLILAVVILSLLLITSGALAGIRDKAHEQRLNNTQLWQQRAQGPEETFGTESSFAMRKPADKPRTEFYNEFPMHRPEQKSRRHSVQFPNDINLHRLPGLPGVIMKICLDPNGVYWTWLERWFFDK